MLACCLEVLLLNCCGFLHVPCCSRLVYRPEVLSLDCCGLLHVQRWFVKCSFRVLGTSPAPWQLEHCCWASTQQQQQHLTTP
jgi:hypothetical protein